MSDGSASSSKTQLEPLRHIGAQDILKIDGKLYEGVVRKRGKWDKLLGSTKWTQRFVVISQGCVYCFKDEYAQRPKSAFSLAYYQSVNEVEIGSVLHCFELVHEDPDKSPHYFSCETEDKMKTWISYLQDALSQAHSEISGGKLSADSDEGICMTPAPKVQPSRRKRDPLPPVPPIPGSRPPIETTSSRKFKSASKSEYDLESDDDLDPYDEVAEENTVVKRRQLAGQVPVLPNTSQLAAMKKKRETSMGNRPPMQLPSPVHEPVTPISPPVGFSYTPTMVDRDQHGQPRISLQLPDEKRPNYVNDKAFKEKDYFIDTTDRDAVKRYLTDRPVGTFLVRRGNSTPTVLCVVTDVGSKDFQIFENEGKLSLNQTMWFPSRDAMLNYYNQNCLPKKEYSVKLKKGYAFKG